MSEEINEMFSKIALQYDFMNHLMSFNFDKSWRGEAAKEAMLPQKQYNILDIAAGTGDLSIAINRLAKRQRKKVRIYLSDFNKDMLAIAERKLKTEGTKNIKTEIVNAFKMVHKSNSLDLLTSGFGLRSFAFSKGGKKNLQKFISESYRVLKPNGKIVLLDMALPDNKFQRMFFNGYSILMLTMGLFIDKPTYEWLVNTIKTFDKNELMRMMKSSGFRNINMRNLTSGIAYLVTAEK